jgi:hypothetical protein
MHITGVMTIKNVIKPKFAIVAIIMDVTDVANATVIFAAQTVYFTSVMIVMLIVMSVQINVWCFIKYFVAVSASAYAIDVNVFQMSVKKSLSDVQGVSYSKRIKKLKKR